MALTFAQIGFDLAVPTQAPPRIQLRPYQEQAIAAVTTAYAEGVVRPLIALPTGAGKTIVFASLVGRRGGRALILAHRDELVQQAVDKLLMVNPAAAVGVVKGERDEMAAPIVVASVQTLARANRRQRLPRHWQTVIVDEAHHAAARSYLDILEHTRSFEPDGPLTLGVTATPERGDGQGLDHVWQRIVFERSILQMIREQYLVDLRAIQVSLSRLDLRAIRTRAGDLATNELDEALREANAPAHAVTAYRDHAGGRRTLIFTPSVELAYEMAAAFQQAGITAAAIDGALPIERRRAVLAAFRAGDIQVLANCAVLTEGFDEPSVECVMIARPTKSRPLYVQMIGRGTRLYPGKSDCLILDLVGASTRHDLITAASLFGLMPREIKRNETVTAALARKNAAPSATSENPVFSFGDEPDGELVAAAVDPFAGKRLHWVQIDEHGQRFVLQIDEGWLALENERDAWTVRQYGRSRADDPQTIASGLSLEYAQGVAEDQARKEGSRSLTNPHAPWRSHPISEAQIAQLNRLGVEIRPGMTKGEASDLLTIEFAARRMRR